MGVCLRTCLDGSLSPDVSRWEFVSAHVWAVLMSGREFVSRRYVSEQCLSPDSLTLDAYGQYLSLYASGWCLSLDMTGRNFVSGRVRTGLCLRACPGCEVVSIHVQMGVCLVLIQIGVCLRTCPGIVYVQTGVCLWTCPSGVCL